MKTVDWPQGTPWDALPEPAQGETFILMQDGHAVALLMPFDDDDLQWYVRERDPAFLASIATARRQVEQGETISHDDLKAQLGLD
jgi:hypothetical protein